MIAATHPLFGRLLEAVSFKRVAGVVYLVVGLPDGTPGTIHATATSVFGDTSAAPDGATVLTVEGIGLLRMLVEARSRQPRSGARRK